MVKDKDQSMSSFVLRHNFSGGYDGQNDQKVDVSGLKVGSGNKKRSTSANAPTARPHAQLQSNKRETRSNTRRDSAPHSQQQNLYGDTDASYADKMSTADSRDGDQPPKTQQQLSESQPQTRNVAVSYDYQHGEDDEEGYAGPGIEDHAADHINGRSGIPGREGVHEGILGKRISGDTYPNTSSGSPSTLGQNRVLDPHEAMHAPRLSNQNIAPRMPARGSGSRAIPHAGDQAKTQAPPQNTGHPGPPGLFSQPGPLDPAGIIAGTGQGLAGFQYLPSNMAGPNIARPGQQTSNARAPQPPHHQSQLQQLKQQHQQQSTRPTSQHGKRSAPTDRAQHGSEVMQTQQTRAHTEHEPRKQVPQQERGEPRFLEDTAPPHIQAKQHTNRAMTPPRQQSEIHPELEPQYSDEAERGFNDYGSAHGHGEEDAPEYDNTLDYDTSELYAMEYRQLKSQPFDARPHAKAFALPGQLDTQELDEKLNAVAYMSPQDQVNFLTSLSIDRWEEAGDWFLGQFGQYVGQFKDIRKAKRKLAREFEDEVESRHDTVAKKYRLTQIALDEMKESGGKVLQGTPKKGKKRN